MKTLYHFYIRIMQIDGTKNSAQGDVWAMNYVDAVDHIYRYHNMLYGKILSIYIQEAPLQTAVAAEIPPSGGNIYGYAYASI